MTRATLPPAALLVTGLAIFFLAPGRTALGGVVLAVLAGLWYPALSLVAAFGTLSLYLQTRPVGPFAFAASELLILAAAAGTLLRGLMAARHGGGTALKLAPTPFDGGAALLLGSALLSLLVTQYLRLSLRELRWLFLEPVLAYYLLLRWFPGQGILWPLGALLAGAAATAAAGLVGLPLGWGWSAAEGVHRLQATYQSANNLGLLLGRAAPWLLALAWSGGPLRWPAIGGAGIIALALFLTFSLGAWLATGAALLVLLGLLLGSRGLVAGIGCIGLAGAGLALLRAERIWSHLQLSEGSTTFFRLQLWQSSLAMLRDHPILGIGLDNFLYLYQQRYILPGALAEPNLSHPHNLVLHFWLALGLPGLVAILWLLGRSLLLAARWLRPPAEPLERALAAGAVGSLVDFVVHGLIDNSYFLPDLALIFWLTLAVLATLAHQASTRSLPSPAPGSLQ